MGTRYAAAWSRPQRPPATGRPGDDGAAAVEFAIVSVLLFTILFGILQYGYVFFQLQSAQSVAGQAARLASLGISTCTGADSYVDGVLHEADVSGLGGSRVTSVSVTWQDAAGAASSAVRGGIALVKINYAPTRLGVVPLPSGDFTVTAQARVEDLGGLLTDCTWPAT